MTTLIFPVFFTESIVPGKWGLTAWAILYGGCEVLSAVFSPPLGAMSDLVNRRRRFLVFFTLTAVAGTALTCTLSHGDMFRAVLFFSIAQLGFSLANVFYNSMLAGISGPEKRETVSGLGWGAGYFGGMLFMIMTLLIMDMDSPAFQRNSFLFTAVWYILFSVPIFFFFEGGPATGTNISLKASYSEVIGTIRKMSGNKPLFYFLLAGFFFNDGVNSAILFGGIFLRKGYGFDDESLFKAFIAFNLIAAAGAWIIGPLADRLSSKRTLFIMMWAWIISLCLLPVLSGKAMLMAIASVVGILIGGTQSVLRGYLSKLAPAEAQGEWFGFYTLMGKAAALAGPLLFGLFYGYFQDIKLSALSLIPLFLLAGIFLKKVEPQR